MYVLGIVICASLCWDYMWLPGGASGTGIIDPSFMWGEPSLVSVQIWIFRRAKAAVLGRIFVGCEIEFRLYQT